MRQVAGFENCNFAEIVHKRWLNKFEKLIMEKILSYRIFLQKEPEGGYTVTVPSLPGCITYGDNIDHAMQMAQEAIELYLESLAANNEEIPDDNAKLEYTITLPVSA